jgi:hypothetical protein
LLGCFMRRGKNVSYTPPRYGLLVMERYGGHCLYYIQSYMGKNGRGSTQNVSYILEGPC